MCGDRTGGPNRREDDQGLIARSSLAQPFRSTSWNLEQETSHLLLTSGVTTAKRRARVRAPCGQRRGRVSQPMLSIFRRRGFKTEYDQEAGVVVARLDLR